MSETSPAAALVQRLEEHVRRTLMGYAERFEDAAERFYYETHFMAPGKSVPMEMWSDDYDRRRSEAWDAWNLQQKSDFIAMLQEAIAALRGGGSSPETPTRERDEQVWKDIRQLHMSFNVAVRRQGVSAPACDGDGCAICEDVAALSNLVNAALSSGGGSSPVEARSIDDALDIYVPGRWKCLQCGFVLSQATLFVQSGAVGSTRDQVMRLDGEYCPNDGTPMRRVTWREDSDESRDFAEKLITDVLTATGARSLPEALKQMAGGGGSSPTGEMPGLERAINIVEGVTGVDHDTLLLIRGRLCEAFRVLAALSAPSSPPPHFWTSEPSDKNRCVVCGDGPWGRHRFQEQPAAASSPATPPADVDDEQDSTK